MRTEQLQGVSRRKTPHTTQRKPGAHLAPNLVKQNFCADAPNRFWVADTSALACGASVTYIPTWTGWFYLAVVVEAWGRKVVIQQRRPEDVIHHADQDRQYTSLEFGQRPPIDGLCLRSVR
jgi:putative transposase